MRVVCSVVATLSLAVLSCRAGSVGPERCCPSEFEVEDPTGFHFRCAQANVQQSCFLFDMNDNVPNTAINSQEGISYLMSDPNWRDQQLPFQQDVACSFYLPPVEGQCWQLWLMKELDPIVNNDLCQCDCEDHVHFDDGTSQSQTFCSSVPQGGDVTDGWCGHPLGPHNIQGLQPFTSRVNTGVLTTFRSDNTNGIGDGALVFAFSSPCSKRRSARTVPPTPWPASLTRTAYCHAEYFRCLNQTCDVPCECYHDRQQQISCTLYQIFTDDTGTTARRNYRSRCDVIMLAARLALDNLKMYRRLVPTYEQLGQNLTTPLVGPQ